MARWVWCLIVCIGARGVQAQDQKDVASALGKLGEQTREYQKSIPNFTCTEVVTTTMKRNGKLMRRVEFQADIHVVRKEDGNLDESFTITNYMGKPAPTGGKFALLLYLTDSLSYGMPSFVDVRRQACYRYRLAQDRLTFEAKAPPPPSQECKETPHTAGVAVLDSQGRILHGEVTRPAKEAEPFHLATMLRGDFSDVRLGDKEFHLPSHVYSEFARNGIDFSFEAYYTACKLFTAKTMIRPGDGVMEPSEP